jgi:hypothetical protein
MVLHIPPQDRSDSQSQDDGTQDRQPNYPPRTSSLHSPNYNANPPSIFGPSPDANGALPNPERTAGQVQHRVFQRFDDETQQYVETRIQQTVGPTRARDALSSSDNQTRRSQGREQLLRDMRGRLREETRLADRDMNHVYTEGLRLYGLTPTNSDIPPLSPPSSERALVPEATLEPRLALPVGKDTPHNAIQQPDQARSYMPSLRSQPEFYMTGVIAVNTTTEPLPDNAECTICLERLSDDVVKFRACGHMFHTVCVQSWFDQSAPRTGKKRGTCPNCRHELYEPDPRHGSAVPPRTAERPVATAPRAHDTRSEEFVADFTRRLNETIEREEQQNPRIGDVVTIQHAARRPHGTPRSWGELARGYQIPRLDALERAQDELDDIRRATTNNPPRPSSSSNAQVARQQARLVVSDVPSPRSTSTMLPELRTAPTPTNNEHPYQPRESRATLAARAIAERRPLTQVPGLNRRDAVPPQPVQVSATPSMQTHVARNRDRLPNHDRLLDEHRRATRARRQPSLPRDLAGLSTLELQEERVTVLGRLRVIEIQLFRNLDGMVPSGGRETNEVPEAEQDHLGGGVRDGMVTHRPPPIAIPRLADPSSSDLRSAQDFPDPRVSGTETSIWSTDSVAPTRDTRGGLIPSRASNAIGESRARRTPPLSGRGDSHAVIADMLTRIASRDTQASSSTGTTRSGAFVAAQSTPFEEDDEESDVSMDSF